MRCGDHFPRIAGETAYCAMRHKKRTVQHAARSGEAPGAACTGHRAWCTVKYRIQQEDKTMKQARLAIAVMVIASLIVPAAYAKPKKARAPLPPSVPAQPDATSQAGGLPATNARVAELERDVHFLQSDLAALSVQLAMTPTVFVAAGSQQNITSGNPAKVAGMEVRPGTYLIMAAVQMVNNPGNAKARCVMKANGNTLAEASIVLFPILSTEANGAKDSTVFAPLQGTYSSAGPIDIFVECSEGNGGSAAYSASVNIAALKVATVNPPLLPQ